MLGRWLRDIERQMWVNHAEQQAVSFAAAIEMGFGDADGFKIVGPMLSRDGRLAHTWYQRHYPRVVVIDALLDARLDARAKVGSRG